MSDVRRITMKCNDCLETFDIYVRKTKTRKMFCDKCLKVHAKKNKKLVLSMDEAQEAHDKKLNNRKNKRKCGIRIAQSEETKISRKMFCIADDFKCENTKNRKPLHHGNKNHKGIVAYNNALHQTSAIHLLENNRDVK